MQISQVLLFLILPTSGRIPQGVAQIDSYDDYFVEHILLIPDHSPENDNDDIERTIQITRIEEFGFLQLLPNAQMHHLFRRNYPGHNITLLPAVCMDIQVPPPQA